MGWWWWLAAQPALWLCAGLVSLLSWKWASRPRVDAPGPPTLPLIGNILDFRDLPVTIRKLRDLHRKYGDLTRVYLGPVLTILVAHPDDVQQVLLTSKLVDRGTLATGAMRTFAGDGSVTLNGSRWKVHRKLINHIFHSEILEGFLEAFHEGGLFVSERLAKTTEAPTEIHPPVFLAALRNVCDTIIGINPDLLLPNALAEEEISVAINDGMTYVQKMVVLPWMRIKFLLRLSAGRGLFKYVEVLQDLARQAIALKSAAEQGGPAKRRLRLLEALVKPGGETAMPLSEVQGEVVNLVIAGSETTAVTISYALAALAFHPEWQDAARQELRDVFGEGDDYLRAANMADLNSLRVLDSIIKETLRLFPTVPLIPRMTAEDLWLSGGQVLVPKDALLLVVPFLTHRLPQFFPNPLRFDPSRFLDGHGGKDHTCSYLPFGLGPRSCVGSQYARLQLKVYLADILRRFRFLPHGRWDDLEDSILAFSLHAVKPIRVTCVPLDGPST